MTWPTYTLKFTTTRDGKKCVSFHGADGPVDRLEHAKEIHSKERAQQLALTYRAGAKAEGHKVRVDVVRALTPMQKCWHGFDRLCDQEVG